MAWSATPGSGHGRLVTEIAPGGSREMGDGPLGSGGALCLLDVPLGRLGLSSRSHADTSLHPSYDVYPRFPSGTRLPVLR